MSISRPNGQLSFDWELVFDQPVLGVIGRDEREISDGSLSWTGIAFTLGHLAVVLSVHDDTDEVVVTHSATPRGDEWQVVPTLRDTIGKPLGWSWVGANYLGYHDSFTLAFGGVVPDILEPGLTFLSVGSRLSCFRLSPLTPAA